MKVPALINQRDRAPSRDTVNMRLKRARLDILQYRWGEAGAANRRLNRFDQRRNKKWDCRKGRAAGRDETIVRSQHPVNLGRKLGQGREIP